MADIRKKSDEKIDQIQKSVDDMKRRELEQTQKLLVGLTNELFDKVEKMNPTKEESKDEEMNPTKEESKVEEISTSEETPKFKFSDISWYRKKLNAEEKNPGTDSTQTKNSSKPKI